MTHATIKLTVTGTGVVTPPARTPTATPEPLSESPGRPEQHPHPPEPK